MAKPLFWNQTLFPPAKDMGLFGPGCSPQHAAARLSGRPPGQYSLRDMLD